jgi:tetratricopeptide (TPR) repeat protein
MKLSLLLILLISVEALPQQVATSEKELKRQREHAQAVSMVEQTAAEAPLWDDKKSAVLALADAADLLWKQTPSAASKWLTKAWELIDSVPDELQDAHLKEFSTRSNKTDLQSSVLRVAHAHDPALADAFVKSLDDRELTEKKDKGAFDDRTARSEQFLRLAQQAVDTNPDLAFALAQRSLADGVSFTLQNVLTGLRRKKVDLSNRLFDLALARFSSSMPDPSEAEVLAGYLFQPGMTFSTNSAGQVIMSMNPMQRNEAVVAQSEPQRARAFLVAAYQAFLNRPVPAETPAAKSRAQKIWVFGMRNLGRYKTYATEFAGPARDFLERLQTQIYPEGRGDPFSSNRQSGSDTTTKPRTEKEIYEDRVTALEEGADKETDPAAKKLAYINAALAVNATDYERGKRVAEKIADDDLRPEVVSYVYYRAALTLVTQKEIDKALELATKLGNLQRRSMVKLAVAQSLLAGAVEEKPATEELTVDQQRAIDLLSDIERDIKKEGPSANAAKILLARATLLGKLDKAQALLSLNDALLVINKLETFDMNDPSAPRLGLRLSARSEALLDSPRIGFNFRRALEPLIATEFESLAEIAGRFSRKEIRGTGRLAVAKLYLQTESEGRSATR